MAKKKAQKTELTIAKEANAEPESTVDQTPNSDTNQPESSQDAAAFITSIFGSPEKLFDYLIKILVAFLIFTVYTLSKVEQKHFNLVLGLVILIALFLATVAIFRGLFLHGGENSQVAEQTLEETQEFIEESKAVKGKKQTDKASASKRAGNKIQKKKE